MSRIYDGSTTARKGTAFLLRLGVSVAFESSVEERALRLWNVHPAITSVQRADAVPYCLPDGSQHVYTADFFIILQGGRSLAVECKPAALLPALLTDDPLGWQIKAAACSQQGRQLYILTDADGSSAQLKQAELFGPYASCEVLPLFQQETFTFLDTRGPAPLADVRAFMIRLLNLPDTVVDGSLYSLLANQQILAEPGVAPPQCRVDIPGRSLSMPPPILGRPLIELLQNPPLLPPTVSRTREPNTLHLEQKFLASSRGERLLHLFSLYPNPEQPLDAAEVARLTAATGISRSGIFRFQHDLREAGGPSATFSEVIEVILDRRKGRPRRHLNLEVELIMEKLARSHYFIPLGTKNVARASSVAQLHGMIRAECLQQELPAPAYNTVDRFIERFIQRDPVRAALLRDGPEAAQQLEPRQGHLAVSRYGEVIGVDCTRADIFALPDGSWEVTARHGRGKQQRKKGAIRGSIVTVVDGATSEVLRSVFFAEAIGAAIILLVLRDIFLGDMVELQAAGVKVLPVGAGLPQKVRVDSGKEFINKQVQRALQHLGIEIIQRNKFSRHHGGIEERTIGTLVHQHHVLPGTTSNNIRNRGEYNAQMGATLSLTEVETFHHLIVERHNLLCAPLQVLNRHEHAESLLRSGMSAWRPPSAEQIDYLRHRMRPEDVRRCQRGGISLHGLMYVAPELAPLIVRKRDVRIIFDPDDISTAEVIHPDTGARITVAARLPSVFDGHPVSLKAWTTFKALLNSAHREARDDVTTVQKLAERVLQESNERVKANQQKPKQSSSRKRDADDGAVDIVPARIVFEYDPPCTEEEDAS